jgi:hypothetical protein
MYRWSRRRGRSATRGEEKRKRKRKKGAVHCEICRWEEKTETACDGGVYGKCMRGTKTKRGVGSGGHCERGLETIRVSRATGRRQFKAQEVIVGSGRIFIHG